MRKTSIQIVKATAPVLQETAIEITKHFYTLLFREYPEVSPMFNQANQQSNRQQHALAGAIIAFAQNVDKPQMLSNALWRIAHKHAALQVQPAQYAAVGDCLLRSISHVLGDAATSEILEAWGEAYNYLANLLMDTEEFIYQTNEQKDGGWRGARRFRVVHRHDESETITSFYLAPTDGGPLAAFRPGQYITLRLDIDGEEVRRSYSLSNAPGRSHYRITVKREPGGLVSNHLHDQMTVGSQLDVYPPCGEFILKDGKDPLVLVTAGVGITPAISMLDHAIHSGRPIIFLHASRCGKQHAFKQHLESIASAYPSLKYAFFYDEPDAHDNPHHVGRIDLDALSRYLPVDRENLDLYFLGPKPFMRAIYGHALTLGVPAERINYEFFGPHEQLTPPKTQRDENAVVCPFHVVTPAASTASRAS